MKNVSKNTMKLVEQTAIPDMHGETDTIKLWEMYKDQAHFWRAVSLLQMPTTFLLVIFSIILWTGRSITLSVPAKPLPGKYLVKDIPDTEFIEHATNFVNLIASYQHAVARRQFTKAKEMLVEPMLSRFEIDMMDIELRAIETTSRSQIYFIDPALIKIDRLSDNEAVVSFVGERMKLVAGKQLPITKARYTITMSTRPRNTINPYGIVITNALFENIEK